MTRVDFYILEGHADNAELFACRLVEKAFGQGHRIYIHVGDAQAAERTDQLLWTFRAGSFVPHGRQGGEDDGTPVQIGFGGEPVGHDDVLVNLNAEVPPFFSRFQRVVELVSGDEENRRIARERYRFYRDRGYELETHTIGG